MGKSLPASIVYDNGIARLIEFEFLEVPRDVEMFGNLTLYAATTLTGSCTFVSKCALVSNIDLFGGGTDFFGMRC